jgi:hypothetical protein
VRTPHPPLPQVPVTGSRRLAAGRSPESWVRRGAGAPANPCSNTEVVWTANP